MTSVIVAPVDPDTDFRSLSVTSAIFRTASTMSALSPSRKRCRCSGDYCKLIWTSYAGCGLVQLPERTWQIQLNILSARLLRLSISEPMRMTLVQSGLRVALPDICLRIGSSANEGGSITCRNFSSQTPTLPQQKSSRQSGSLPGCEL